MTVAATVALAGPLSIATADHRSESMTVSARVLPRASVTALDAPGQIAIGADELARGSVEVAVRYRVQGNDARGVRLLFAPRLGYTTAIEVRADGAVIPLTDLGAEWLQAGRGTRDLEIVYLLHLQAGLRTGEYPLPVLVSAAPL